MSLVEIVEDLLTLTELAEDEDDIDRRRALAGVLSRMAGRDRGAKVSDAAIVLRVSQPTVRSWMDAGVLEPVRGAKPARVDVLSLASAKRAVDLLREHGHDRRLLAAVMRRLRDGALLAGDGVSAGLEDIAAGRTVTLTDEWLHEQESASQEKGRPASS